MTFRRDDALLAAPAIAHVNAPASGTFGVYQKLSMKASYAGPHPQVEPAAGQETRLDSFAVRVLAKGAIGNDGRPLGASTSQEFSIETFFEMKGTLTVTSERLIGTGTSGNSRLGAMDNASWLHFSLSLSDLYRAEVLQAEAGGFRSKTKEVEARLWFPEVAAYLSVAVIGRLGKGSSKARPSDLVRIAAAAAADRRLQGATTEEERTQLAAVQAGVFATEGGKLVMIVGNPDDPPLPRPAPGVPLPEPSEASAGGAAPAGNPFMSGTVGPPRVSGNPFFL